MPVTIIILIARLRIIKLISEHEFSNIYNNNDIELNNVCNNNM